MLSSHSPFTALNLLSANSGSGDTDSLWRSRLLGVKMTSGLRYGPDHLPAQQEEHLHRRRRARSTWML